ncbi:MAG: LysE family translocator [Hyphomicrobiaceae bacterium]
MAPAETLIAFALAVAVFAYIPGPAIMYTAAQTLARGRRAGFMAAIGLHVGGYVHVFAAAFGLSAILTHVPTVYAAIRIIGALYLIWLGIGLIRQTGANATRPSVAPKSGRRAFMESIVVEVFNPKAALFFLAFLPQFADPSAMLPMTAQLIILGVITLLAFTSADILTVVMASAIAKRTSENGAGRKVLGWFGGGILIALGTKFALDHRS